MNHSDVASQVGLGEKGFSARLAVKLSAGRVAVLGGFVHVQVVLFGRPVVTLVAGERLLPGVLEQVVPQLVLLGEGPAAESAGELLEVKLSRVLVQHRLVGKTGFAVVTLPYLRAVNTTLKT